MVLYLYLGAVVWAGKYFYTSDMALRPSSLHLLTTHNLPEAARVLESIKIRFGFAVREITASCSQL